jgi:uncharacterized protein (TIGR03083 family)
MAQPNIQNCLIDTLNEITSLSKSLTKNQLSSPTNCPGWDVKDNISHIISIEAFLLGDKPTDHRATDLTHVKNDFGRFNENEIDLRRSYETSKLVEELQDVVNRRIRYLKSLTKSDLMSKAWTPVGEKTLYDQCLIRLLDCFAHLQDIKTALNFDFDTTSVSSAIILNYCILTVPKTFAKTKGVAENNTLDLSINTQVDLNFTDIPLNHTENMKNRCISFRLQKINGRGEFVDKPLGSPTCKISLNHQTFIELCLGRINAESVREFVEISGDTSLGVQILANLNFMI